MPRNPSELARLDEERDGLMKMVKYGYLSKKTKEEYVREIRSLEKQLGISGEDYNSELFNPT